MREIIYVGKRKDNGKWVKGFPFVRKNTQGEIIDYFIIEDAYEQITDGQRYVRSNLNQECFRVYPETVSQFTGQLDIDGDYIYEGNVWEYNGVRGFVRYCEEDCEFEAVYRIGGIEYQNTITENAAKRLKIIGNIHDNPELLEG